MRLTSKALLAALLVTVATSGSAKTSSPCQTGYEAAMALKEDAPSQAAQALRALSGEGCGRATGRLAYFQLNGIGLDEDPDAALALYSQAVEQGQTNALVTLSKLHMRRGAPETARVLLDLALDEGVRNAPAVHAWAHATKRLGAASDPEQGWQDLAHLAEAGDRTAELSFLAALTKEPRRKAKVDQVLQQLHDRVAEGDAKSAETLLRFYRIRGHSRGTVAVREALLTTPGIRDKIKVEEGLYIALLLRPRHFWTEAETIVRSAPNDVFARALVVTAKLDKNAYVRILQKELTGLGYRTGRASGYLTRPTIRSVNQFCRDTDIAPECRFGPLKSTVIKVVSRELAGARKEI